MSNSFRGFLVRSVIAVMSSLAVSQTSLETQAQSTLMMTVHVYDYAGISAGALAQAEQVATQIFRQVGIELTWQDRSQCLSQPESEQCQFPIRATDLVVQILTKAMAERHPFRETTLGWAIPSSQVYISYYRVIRQAALGPVTEGQMLGYAIGHEIGHLLLGSNSHSVGGIMQARWGLNELERAARDLLLLPHQAKLVREEVLRRMRLQISNASSR